MDSVSTAVNLDREGDTSQGKSDAHHSLTLVTLLAYLSGSRDAILQVANSRTAIWLGLAFVISAGFAREYDGEDLWHEPWHLALPLVASIGTSLALYVMVYLAAFGRGISNLSFVAGYRTLLTLWWTAPLAWLYAIPVERFLSPADATSANLGFLAIVSVWRVLLMTRVLSVWLNGGVISLFLLVMLFADSVLVALTYFVPVPIFNIMGGVRLSESDAILAEVAFLAVFFGTMSWPVWLVATGVAIGLTKRVWSLAVPVPGVSRGASAPLWIFAVLLILLGVGLLPIGQPEQQRRWQLERYLRADQLDGASQYAARFTREDFPPAWDPPPRIGYGEDQPSPIAVLQAIVRTNGPDWLREIYLEKFTRSSDDALFAAIPDDQNGDWTEFDRILAMHEKFVPLESLDVLQLSSLRSIASSARVDNDRGRRLRAYLQLKDDEAK